MKQAIVIIVTCLLGTAYIAYDMTRTPANFIPAAQEVAPVQMQNVPDVQLVDMHGNLSNLHDYAGKRLIINFWATWCAPCVVEFPDLLEIADQRADDTVLIAITVDRTLDVLQPFFKRLPDHVQPFTKADNVIIAHDPEKIISQDVFQTIKYPETYVINPDLTINRKIVGALTPTDIETLLSE